MAASYALWTPCRMERDTEYMVTFSAQESKDQFKTQESFDSAHNSLASSKLLVTTN